MRCDDLAEVIAASADPDEPIAPDARAHIDTCLRCQAEAVQYRRLRRAIRGLERVQIAPQRALDDEILAVLDDPSLLAHRGRVGRRAAYLSGLAAATAAGAAGAIVIASRARSRRLAG